MEKWTPEKIPSQKGRVALITGGTDGIGFEIALELARRGAEVILAADDVLKGERALRLLKRELPQSRISFERLDLADLTSVASFAQHVRSNYMRLDLLINNGGLAAVPERLQSKQGYELMFAVNYLAHFALTAELFGLIEETPGARIIFQSSLEHKEGVIDFFDLNATHLYDSKKAYAQSKLALLLFARELDRRLRLTHLQVKSIPVHPGGSRTNIFSKGPELSSRMIRPYDFVNKLLVYSFGQSASKGAWPALFAATSPVARSGHYYGPDGPYGMRGYPTEVEVGIQAKNLQAAQKLWSESEALTGLEFRLMDYSNVLPFQVRGNIQPEGWGQRI
jgi:NAD(P)-dependent dehydrogenase (short-subunit alcohol dehydrogenase family)